jgi:hypothetical protein
LNQPCPQLPASKASEDVKKSSLGRDAGCGNVNCWTPKRTPLVERIRHAMRESGLSTDQKQPKTTSRPFFGRAFGFPGHFFAYLSEFFSFCLTPALAAS